MSGELDLKTRIRLNRQFVKTLSDRLIAQDISKVAPWVYLKSETPFQVWASRRYLVQVYIASLPRHPQMIRMSVNRSLLGKDGRWLDGLTWDELQRIKSEVGYGNWYGCEMFPPDHLVINVANIRHLWLNPQPFGIGWNC